MTFFTKYRKQNQTYFSEKFMCFRKQSVEYKVQESCAHGFNGVHHLNIL